MGAYIPPMENQMQEIIEDELVWLAVDEGMEQNMKTILQLRFKNGLLLGGSRGF